MKFLFDIFPVILFFGFFKWGEGHADTAQAITSQYLSGLVSGGIVSPDQAPILLATAIAMLASVLQIGYLLVRRKSVDAMLWISFIIISVFGSLTIYFHSETFIKWKPTVLYWCYGAALLMGQFFFKKNLIRAAMESQIKLPDGVWAKLSLAWIGFCVVMGIANIFVAFNFSTDTWVNFKLICVVAIMPAFVIVQSLFLSKYMEEVA
ncbi:septation protein A [Undibacterium terreum]|uniref:Inner membrane-spanning protein YciB n=1 Tax=Undibacterium terreum TaxID=1224302 RepID=A0A916UY79_9BURK|nr:septation protein A [Undibacterium terreum]GGC92460.1 putative intracellular septation protein A [Undibacterium terreum]